MPISTGDNCPARASKITAPVATVKVETNNIPAKNAPKYPRLPRFSKKAWSGSNRDRSTAKKTEATNKVRFLYLNERQ